MAVFFKFSSDKNSLNIAKTLSDKNIISDDEFAKHCKKVDKGEFLGQLSEKEQKKFINAFNKYEKVNKTKLLMTGSDTYFDYEIGDYCYECCIYDETGCVFKLSTKSGKKKEIVLFIANEKIKELYGDEFYLRYKKYFFYGWNYFIDKEKAAGIDYYRIKEKRIIYNKAYNIRYFLSNSERQLVQKYHDCESEKMIKNMQKVIGKRKRN